MIQLVQNGGPKGARNCFYRQKADGTFEDISAGSGLDVAGYGMGVAIGDMNNDGLPDVYLTGYQLNLLGLSDAESYSRLTWAAERALALDDESADAHVAFALAHWWQRNWPGAARELARAFELEPGHATARRAASPSICP